MYDIIYDIIQHSWNSNYGSTEQQYIYFVCAALIIILTVFFCDLIVRVFSHFWK